MLADSCVPFDDGVSPPLAAPRINLFGSSGITRGSTLSASLDSCRKALHDPDDNASAIVHSACTSDSRDQPRIYPTILQEIWLMAFGSYVTLALSAPLWINPNPCRVHDPSKNWCVFPLSLTVCAAEVCTLLPRGCGAGRALRAHRGRDAGGDVPAAGPDRPATC